MNMNRDEIIADLQARLDRATHYADLIATLLAQYCAPGAIAPATPSPRPPAPIPDPEPDPETAPPERNGRRRRHVTTAKGGITERLRSELGKCKRGDPICLGIALRNIGCGKCPSTEYKTAQSAVSRWIKAGELRKSAVRGQYFVTEKWGLADVGKPSGKEAAYRALRAGMGELKVPEIEGSVVCSNES
jgi:hypothetical protein